MGGLGMRKALTWEVPLQRSHFTPATQETKNVAPANFSFQSSISMLDSTA